MGVRKEENGRGGETDRMFWKRRSLCLDFKRTLFLNTWVINAGMKGGDGSAIGKGMKLMKRWLCLNITAILGNSKSRYYSWQEKGYIYIYMRRGL